MEIKSIIEKMSLEDKIALCSGKDFWNTKDYPKYNIPSMTMADGPHGLRKQKANADMLGINESVPTTCFPTAVTSASAWNKELLFEIGEAIGEEAKEEEIPLVLGPGVNIKRNPLCGRNFEYFSEDPFLAGKLGSFFVKGLQSTGIQASLKHFAANSQEYKRFSSDSQMDERTLREIYLSAFEEVVKDAKPATVMCAYNKINGVYCSDNKELLTDILRNEWGFEGMVITDWGAMANRIKSFIAGCDLSMPGGAAYQEKEALKAVNEGRLSEKEIDQSVGRILKAVFHGQKINIKEKNFKYDKEEHQKLSQRVAEEGAVLLKNEGDILPLKELKGVTLIGNMAKNIRYQGSGSSHINPTKLIQVTEVMPEANYVEGCDENGNTTQEELKKVSAAARESTTVIVCVGLPNQYESEGYDRDNLELPKGHNQMVEAAVKANPNTIVILMGGSAMKLSWFEKVKAVLYMGLCGQSGGLAIKNIVTGKINPSGKLAETWPLEERDIPSYGFYAGKYKNAQYREGIYVGYRYYEKAGVKVRFPFGYGLSYTSFDYSELVVDKNKIKAKITNVGKRDGAEVIQLYIKAPQNGIHRANKELKGFEKVFLKPGESKRVEFELDDRSFGIYQEGWKVPKGVYTIQIGASSKDIRLSKEIEVEGEDVMIPDWQKGSWYEQPKGQATRQDWVQLMENKKIEDAELRKGQFTMDNTLLELKEYSLLAKIMCKVIESTVAKGMGIKPDYTNPEFRMSINSSVDCSLRGMVICACGKFPAKFTELILYSANGRRIKSIKKR